MKQVRVNNLVLSNDAPFALMAGPCALESRDMALKIAEHLKKVTSELHIPFIFKASFDKANRTSINSKRGGVKMEEALKIFEEIKKTYSCSIVTDIHESYQCEIVASVVDVLQIPAFLCRQTDLVVSAAKTNKVINIKKGQFLAPWDMKHILEKSIKSGNENIILCERGSCFGYNSLIVDMRSLPILESYGYPVFFDTTHSVQEPSGLGEKSGGKREFIEVLARAAISVGVAGIFMETHFDPDNAISDGPNMMPLKYVKDFLKILLEFDQISKKSKYIDVNNY